MEIKDYEILSENKVIVYYNNGAARVENILHHNIEDGTIYTSDGTYIVFKSILKGVQGTNDDK